MHLRQGPRARLALTVFSHGQWGPDAISYKGAVGCMCGGSRTTGGGPDLFSYSDAVESGCSTSDATSSDSGAAQCRKSGVCPRASGSCIGRDAGGMVRRRGAVPTEESTAVAVRYTPAIVHGSVFTLCRVQHKRRLGVGADGELRIGVRLSSAAAMGRRQAVGVSQYRRLARHGWVPLPFAATGESNQDCSGGCTIARDLIEFTDDSYPGRANHLSHHLHSRGGTIACCRCGRRTSFRVSLPRPSCPQRHPLDPFHPRRWLDGGDFDGAAAMR